MNGSLIVKRDPVTIGAVLISLLGLVGVWADLDPVLTAALVGIVIAGVAVIQSVNVFGTDKFTSVAVNLVGALLAALLAFNLNINEDVQTALLAAIPILLGLFARGAVTNRFSTLGELTAIPAVEAASGSGSFDATGNERL